MEQGAAMQAKRTQPAETGNSQGQIDAPAPTIVGPRPAEGVRNKITIPQGMEHLLLMAGLNPEWKKKTLADPLRTAQEAQIELSASERAILKSVSSQSLAGMIASFARHQWQALKGPALATGAAAAALLAAEGSANAAGADVSKGIRPDQPPPKPVEKTTPVPAAASLAETLTKAQASTQAVMVCCGIGSLAPEVKKAADDAKLLTVNIPRPAAGSEEEKNYNDLLLSYSVTDTNVAAIFLAPDGKVLRKTSETDAAKLTGIVNSIPLLLARWVADKNPPPDDENMVIAGVRIMQIAGAMRRLQ
jgi:hypothetical protein